MVLFQGKQNKIKPNPPTNQKKYQPQFTFQMVKLGEMAMKC